VILGRLLRERRNQLRLSIRDVAQLAGIGVATVHALERGRLQIQLDNFLQVLRVLELSAGDALPPSGEKQELPSPMFNSKLSDRVHADLPGLLKEIAEVLGTAANKKRKTRGLGTGHHQEPGK